MKLPLIFIHVWRFTNLNKLKSLDWGCNVKKLRDNTVIFQYKKLFWNWMIWIYLIIMQCEVMNKKMDLLWSNAFFIRDNFSTVFFYKIHGSFMRSCASNTRIHCYYWWKLFGFAIKCRKKPNKKYYLFGIMTVV